MIISRFFSWWMGELTALFPASKKSTTANSGRLLVLELRGDDVRIGVEGGRGARAVVPRGDSKRLLEAVQEIAATLDPSRTRVQVRVPAAQALCTTPSLPLAAEENLREVLGFEMDRLTPFRVDDVYFSFDVQHRDRDAQRLDVDLCVVRRSLVAPLLAGLEGWTLAPSVRGLGRGKGESLEEQVLLEFTPGSFRRSATGKLNLVLAVTAAMLAALAIYLPLSSQAEYRGHLERQLDDAKKEAAQAIQVREQLELETSAARILANARGGRPSTVEILDIVTHLLPDHTYLFRFEVKGDTLNIQGSSQAASSLIALLDANSALTNVRFVSPVTRDARSGGERFHISTRLLSPVAGDAAARSTEPTSLPAPQPPAVGS